MEKFFNDAIIGNKEITASFTKKGELIRYYFPFTDYRQFIDFMHIGLQINDSSMIYLHSDVNNIYNQYYIEHTNILNTEIYNSYFNVNIVQTDFICDDKNVLIKKYRIKNEGTIDLNTNFIIYSSLLDDENNDVSGYYKDNVLFQYMHDYTFAICTDKKIEKNQINNNKENIDTGIIEDKDYIGMSKDSSISVNLGKIKSGQEVEFAIYMTAFKGSDIKTIEKQIKDIKNIEYKKELDRTKKYWEKYLNEHDKIKLPSSNTEYMKKIKKIYERTILLYPILINYKTGGISAAIEVDENKTKCGRYSYCWPRDRYIYNKCIRYT